MKRVLIMLIGCIFSWSSLQAKNQKSIFMYAADHVSAVGGRFERSTDVKGLKFLGGIRKGNSFCYDIDVKETGVYLFQYRVTCARDALIKVSVLSDNGNETELERVCLPKSGGWRHWITYVGSKVNLSKEFKE